MLPGAGDDVPRRVALRRHRRMTARRLVIRRDIRPHAHRVDESGRRQDRRAAPRQQRVRADRVADQAQPELVGLDTGHVRIPGAVITARVAEVDLEVVDAPVA
jgi:hypothetical protein